MPRRSVPTISSPVKTPSSPSPDRGRLQPASSKPHRSSGFSDWMTGLGPVPRVSSSSPASLLGSSCWSSRKKPWVLSTTTRGRWKALKTASNAQRSVYTIGATPA